jgi:hypothetical protein
MYESRYVLSSLKYGWRAMLAPANWEPMEERMVAP